VSCPAPEVDTSLGGRRVVEVLERSAESRGYRRSSHWITVLSLPARHLMNGLTPEV